jgi:hypothetical protein
MELLERGTQQKLLDDALVESRVGQVRPVQLCEAEVRAAEVHSLEVCPLPVRG